MNPRLPSLLRRHLRPACNEGHHPRHVRSRHGLPQRIRAGRLLRQRRRDERAVGVLVANEREALVGARARRHERGRRGRAPLAAVALPRPVCEGVSEGREKAHDGGSPRVRVQSDGAHLQSWGGKGGRLQPGEYDGAESAPGAGPQAWSSGLASQVRGSARQQIIIIPQVPTKVCAKQAALLRLCPLSPLSTIPAGPLTRLGHVRAERAVAPRAALAEDHSDVE